MTETTEARVRSFNLACLLSESSSLNVLTRRSLATAQPKSDVLRVALSIRSFDCVVVNQRFPIFSEPHSFSDRDLHAFMEMMRLMHDGSVFRVAERMMTVPNTAILSEPVTASATAYETNTGTCCLTHTFLL